jgi:protein-tyrosine kinase
VAVNLAMSLSAERNLQVLLIDTDVIRPSVPQFFTGAAEPGLTDFLTGRCRSTRDIIRPCVDIPNLSVIFSGRHEDNSPELFASNKMEEFCQDVSAENPNRILIFDAPPALATSEPTALAMQMHHVLLIAAADQPSRTEIEEALSRVSACPRLHLVFNKSPLWRQTANSKYSYYYRTDEATKLG